MKINQLKNKKILILGFAREGMSSYKFLRRYFRNEKIGIADNKKINEFDGEYRKILKKDKLLDLYLGKNYLKALDKFKIIIKTPGIKLDDKLIKKLLRKNILITSNLNIFLSNIKGKIIGITGSKGKGTTATLIYKIFKTAGKKVYLVGNIGQPFLDYITKDSENTLYVAELSSFHLDNLQGEIDTAVVTSFFPEHIKEHTNLNNYFKAKMNIVGNLNKNGVVVHDKNYKKVANYIKAKKVKAIGYDKPRLKVETNLLGEHNLSNTAAALEVANLYKIKDNVALRVSKNFKGLPYRLEPIGKFKGISFYCDTLGTTPETTIKAIKALKEKNLQTLIVGGVSKGGDYTPLAKEIIKSKIRTLILLPNIGVEIGNLVKKIRSKYKPGMAKVRNMKAAIDKAYKLTQSGEAVVLSPAGASFDQYKDYADKGEDFKKWVKKLG